MVYSVEEIIQNAKKNRWPYPKTFEMLKNAGVTEYVVRFIENFDACYKGEFGLLQEPVPTGYEGSLFVGDFSQDGIRQALNDHIAGKRNYVEFLSDIAAAGVTHYKVNMYDRTVTYYNNDETHFHQEIVPSWKE